MFYILECEHHKLVGRISFQSSGWGLDFTEGELLDPKFGGDITVEFEANHASLPDYFELDETPIVSENFIKAWKLLPVDNYQLFPVTVKFPDSQLQGYYILNVVGRVACIDLDASDLKKFKNVIVRINKLVLDADIQMVELFRASEFPLAIFISETIQQQLSLAKLSGLLMKPADGWNDKHRF